MNMAGVICPAESLQSWRLLDDQVSFCQVVQLRYLLMLTVIIERRFEQQN
jgi:hypothetical protein